MLNRRLLFQFMIFKKIEKKQGEEFSELSALLFVYCNDRFPLFSVSGDIFDLASKMRALEKGYHASKREKTQRKIWASGRNFVTWAKNIAA